MKHERMRNAKECRYVVYFRDHEIHMFVHQVSLLSAGTVGPNILLRKTLICQNIGISMFPDTRLQPIKTVMFSNILDFKKRMQVLRCWVGG